VLLFSLLLVSTCLASAAIVWYGNNRLGALERVNIAHAVPQVDVLEAGALQAGESVGSGPTTVPETLPPTVDVRAQNFLLVGSDSRDCIDPNSPYAGAFLNEDFAGNRSDTIMVLRVNPDADQAAILSFPRDLWVKIAGTNRRSRINSAFDKDNPSLLVKTIESNFGIPIDHYIEVDFCAFKNIVDAVGGVQVPFKYPTRDKNTGLDVAAPGCVALNGDAALAYVRSRHYQWFDGKRWREDDSSDFGRIKRQQDFIRRALQRAIDRGARRPTVAKDLLDTALKTVRVDQDLTISDLLSLADRLRTFDPAEVRTFRIDGTPTIISDAQVILPDTTSSSAKRLLRVFKGEAVLADLPDQTAPDTSSVSPTTAAPVTIAIPVGPTTTVPTVNVVDNSDGIYPPDDPTCR
jgi:LCP family protein required for cell wall assembly